MSDRRRQQRRPGEKQAYIAYSSRDRAAAEQVADAFRRQRVNVWIDREELSGAGDDFQSRIVEAIEGSDIVVLLWSEAAANSSFLLREIQLANARDKPLAVVMVDRTPLTPDVEYYVAGAQHVDLQNVTRLAASIAITQTSTLAEEKRQAQSSRGFNRNMEVKSRRSAGLSRLRISAGYWIGIVSAIITLAGNLEKIIEIARLIRGLLGVWADILLSVWRTLIPFRINIVAEDAIILTFMTVMFFNLIVTSRQKDITVRTRGLDYLFLVTGLAGVSYLSFLGFLQQSAASERGIVAMLTEPLIAWAHALVPASLDAAVGFLTMMLAAVVVIAVLYTPVAAVIGIRPNINAFSVRLWRILAGVLILVVLNFLALWIEVQPWAAGTILGG